MLSSLIGRMAVPTVASDAVIIIVGISKRVNRYTYNKAVVVMVAEKTDVQLNIVYRCGKHHKYRCNELMSSRLQ